MALERQWIWKKVAKMDSLKKLSIDILDKGVPDKLIYELIERGPKTVYIRVTVDRTSYEIRYVRALSRYHVRDPEAANRASGENEPLAPKPDLLLDFDSTVVFIELFNASLSGGYSASTELHMLGHSKRLFPGRNGLIEALRTLKGACEAYPYIAF